MSKKKVILLEFNELCPTLLERFIEQGHLPNFRKLRDGAKCFTTDANCEIDYLEPWTQWVTLHTGLPFEKHKVFRLGQAQNLEHDSIWDILSRNKLSSWICGSMNAKWDPKDNNIKVLPDPWSIDVKASPESLETFNRFVRANVQEHSNERFKLSISEYAKFLIFMLGHGLRFKTIKKIGSALFKQLIKAPDRWKKVMVLDWLQFDLFANEYKNDSPAFATFFSNSTAHFQHKYWRYMEPDKFMLKPSKSEIEQLGGAILYAYKNHDELIGEVFKIADSDTTIILSSALSQQPYISKDSVGGKRFYRPIDMQVLPSIFNLKGVEKVSPVMSHQFHLMCETEEYAKKVYDQLNTASAESEPLFSLRLEAKDVFGGCQVIKKVPDDFQFKYQGKDFSFLDIFYLADSLKSGMHHPHGVFWVYSSDGEHSVQADVLPLEQVMVKILSEFDLPLAA